MKDSTQPDGVHVCFDIDEGSSSRVIVAYINVVCNVTEQWTTQLHELIALWKVEPRTVMVATKSTTLLEAAIAAGCLTVEHVTSAEKRKQRLSAVKADYVVKEVLGVKEKVEEINGALGHGVVVHAPIAYATLLHFFFSLHGSSFCSLIHLVLGNCELKSGLKMVKTPSMLG